MGLFSNTMNKLFGTHSQREVKALSLIHISEPTRP